MPGYIAKLQQNLRPVAVLMGQMRTSNQASSSSATNGCINMKHLNSNISNIENQIEGQGNQTFSLHPIKKAYCITQHCL